MVNNFTYDTLRKEVFKRLLIKKAFFIANIKDLSKIQKKKIIF